MINFLYFSFQKYEIYFGTQFSSGKAFKAKRVIKNPINASDYYRMESKDIGLIQLEESVYNENIGDYRYINTICLPEKNIKNDRKEPAFISGWGKKNSESHGQLKIANAFINSGDFVINIENVRSCLVSAFHIIFIN